MGVDLGPGFIPPKTMHAAHEDSEGTQLMTPCSVQVGFVLTLHLQISCPLQYLYVRTPQESRVALTPRYIDVGVKLLLFNQLALTCILFEALMNSRWLASFPKHVVLCLLFFVSRCFGETWLYLLYMLVRARASRMVFPMPPNP